MKKRQVAIISPSNRGYIIWGDHDTVLLNALFTELTAHNIYSLHMPSTALIPWCKNGRYDEYSGAIVISPQRFPRGCQTVFSKLMSCIPCVAVMEPFPRGGNAILTDDVFAMNSIVDHLAGEGCRRIGFLSTMTLPWAVERFSAFLSALVRHRLPIEAEWMPGFDPASKRPNAQHVRKSRGLIGFSHVNDAVDELAQKILHSSTRPDAVICVNDIHACRMIRAIRSFPLHIPKDIAVTGFDNSRILGPLGINPFHRVLTSVDRNPVGAGVEAVKLLIRVLSGAVPGCGNIVRVLPTIVVKQSSQRRRSLIRQSSSDVFSRHVAHYLEQHLKDRAALRDIARVFGMSYPSFLNRFRKEFRISFGAYVREKCLAAAALLVRTTSRSITGIARNAGLGRYQNFVRRFIKAYGLSPREYRRCNARRKTAASGMGR